MLHGNESHITENCLGIRAINDRSLSGATHLVCLPSCCTCPLIWLR